MVEVIENAGPNTLADSLGALLGSSSDVRLQVAFVSQTGLEAVLSGLHRAATRGTVRIITGLYQCVTEPAALRSLLHAVESTNGRIQVRLSTNPKLHAKLYLLGSKGRFTCIVGSSNLTADGLTSPGELSLLFRAKARTRAVARLVDCFEESWARHSVSLTREQVDKYEVKRKQQPRPSLSTADFRAIVGRSTRSGPRKGPARGPASRRRTALWRDYITGFFDPVTETVLERETDWDRRGWDCHSYPSPGLRNDDLVAVFDFTRRVHTLRLVRVRARTRTSIPTPDGRWFVAYSRIPRTRERRLTKGVWAQLAECGVVKSRRGARRCTLLAPGKANDLRRLLR